MVVALDALWAILQNKNTLLGCNGTRKAVTRTGVAFREAYPFPSPISYKTSEPFSPLIERGHGHIENTFRCKALGRSKWSALDSHDSGPVVLILADCSAQDGGDRWKTGLRKM
jgi:hypothetical protein